MCIKKNAEDRKALGPTMSGRNPRQTSCAHECSQDTSSWARPAFLRLGPAAPLKPQPERMLPGAPQTEAWKKLIVRMSPDPPSTD